MNEPVLSPEVDQAYDLNTLSPGTYVVPGFGTIDLTTISKESADRLVNFGFPFLTPKAGPTPKAAATKASAAKAVVVTDPPSETENAPNQ